MHSLYIPAEQQKFLQGPSDIQRGPSFRTPVSDHRRAVSGISQPLNLCFLKLLFSPSPSLPSSPISLLPLSFLSPISPFTNICEHVQCCHFYTIFSSITQVIITSWSSSRTDQQGDHGSTKCTLGWFKCNSPERASKGSWSGKKRAASFSKKRKSSLGGSVG